MKQYKIIKPLTEKELLIFFNELNITFSKELVLKFPKKMQLKFKELR